MKAKNCTVLLVPTEAWERLHETLQMDTQSSAFDSNLRQEIREALNQVKTIKAKPRIAVVVQGGLVTDILCDQPAEAVRIDYDIEGSDEEELTLIPQGDGSTDEACASGYEVEVNPQRVEELFNAVKTKQGVQPC